MSQEEVLFNITEVELVYEDITEFEIDLATGIIDCVFCNMCGSDMNAEEAYEECRSYFGRTTFLCNDCDIYHPSYHYESDKWLENVS